MKYRVLEKIKYNNKKKNSQDAAQFSCQETWSPRLKDNKLCRTN